MSIKNWQTEDFLNSENYTTLEKQVKEFLFYNMEAEAIRLYRELLEKYDIIRKLSILELKDRYLKLWLTLKFVALPRLTDEEVLELVRQDLVYGFTFDQDKLDIKDKFRKKLTTILLRDRDSYKKKLTGALEKNEQVIGSGLDINGEKIKSTVANWITDYRKFIVDNDLDEKLAKAEYLYKNKNVVNLSKEEKEKVKILLDLHNYWQKSSLTLAGNEDAITFGYNGKTYGAFKGEIFEIGGDGGVDRASSMPSKVEQKILTEQITSDQEQTLKSTLKSAGRDEGWTGADSRAMDSRATARVVPTEKLQDQFQKFLITLLIINSFQKQEIIEKQIGKDLKNLRNKFYHSVNEGKAEEAVGALLVMAEAGKLGEAFGKDDRFVKFWAGYLTKSGLVEEAERFKNDPSNQKYLAMFLEYILVNRLKMKPDQAAMTGVLVANTARQAGEVEYQAIAYGDEETGEFRWNY